MFRILYRALGEVKPFSESEKRKPGENEAYEGGAALSYGDFFILRTEGLTFAHRVDSFIAAPVIVRPLPPRHSRALPRHSREIPPPFPRNPPVIPAKAGIHKAANSI